MSRSLANWAACWRSVSPDYFNALRIRLLRGRQFTAQDDGNAAGVVLINRAMFLKYEQGDKPPKPRALTGIFSGNALTITAGDGSKNITFRVTIKRPSGPGPHPAIITYGSFSSIPIRAHRLTTARGLRNPPKNVSLAAFRRSCPRDQR